MAAFLTIDGGTTNTRISLLKGEKVVDAVKLSGGAGAARKDQNAQKNAIRNRISELLTRNSLKESDVERILASGMITSEFGLYTLPHAIAPIGLAGLHDAMKEVILPEVSGIPFVFMRGVKCMGDFAITDMMRGEETELMGLMDEAYGACVYVLPGSHSKVIKTDAEGRIESFSTLLSGEMFYALSQHTILGDAVDMSVEGFDAEYLLTGYRYALENGINKAVFKTRVQKNMFGATPLQCSSYFRGVILCDEIREILRYDVPTVVLGGKKQMREATAAILRAVSDKRVICLSDEEVESSVVKGQLKIYYAK
ncbi:MAG: hypothetical protein E7590_06345 [Ruminococcaceae bacterium]|nr:hypothetical protein [Oscillospiraceae bacterium]